MSFLERGALGEAATPQCVSLLLRAKASHSASDGHGVQPIHAACSVGSLECLQQLIDSGADVDARLSIAGKHDLSHLSETHTRTAMYLAAEHGHASILRLLVKKKADVNALATIETDQALTKTSPLWVAKRGGHEEAAKVLVEAGAKEVAETVAKEVPVLV